MRIWKYLLPALLLTGGCVGAPEGIEPVGNFDLYRYLGTWYEIARLDHDFERGLSNVSAVYTPREDGGMDVVNRGFNDALGKWKEARGKAFFTGDPSVGSLKVSFFGPFYGGYNVIRLDEKGYSFSVICGPTREYLWILSRSREMDEETLRGLVEFAKGLGFDTDRLIYVRQDIT